MSINGTKAIDGAAKRARDRLWRIVADRVKARTGGMSVSEMEDELLVMLDHSHQFSGAIAEALGTKTVLTDILAEVRRLQYQDARCDALLGSCWMLVGLAVVQFIGLVIVWAL